MFAKLLKHEWRGCRNILGILCAIILGSGVTIGLCTLYLTWLDGLYQETPRVLSVILMVAAFLALGVSAAAGFLYLIWRFYQSRFTDEGYLTFTLPVTSHQLLLCSVLNTIRGCLLIFLAVLGALFLALLTFLVAYPLDYDWAGLCRAVWEWMPEFFASVYWPDYLLLLLAALAALLSGLMILMLSVTAGSILAKKHPLLMAVVVYYGIGILRNTVYSFLLFSDRIRWDNFMSFSLVLNLVTVLIAYGATHWLQDKKLNLT